MVIDPQGLVKMGYMNYQTRNIEDYVIINHHILNCKKKSQIYKGAVGATLCQNEAEV